jgi:multidrug efflux pump subunit AcrA (membrane-fusion protein)
MKPGKTEADIVLAGFPGQKFPGKAVRTAEAINAATRTLLTEIDLPNPGNTLLTGSHAEVHLTVPSQTSTFLIPVNTLIFRSDGLQAGVVRNGQVELADLTPGHDLGSEIEIVGGLRADDQLVMNPPESLVSGQRVNVVKASLPGDAQ